MADRFDVIVIGAGVAGLAAARDLYGAGKKVCILEGRERIGGRIWTLHAPDLPLPIELGVEFIHGEAEDTFSIVESAALLREIEPLLDSTYMHDWQSDRFSRVAYSYAGVGGQNAHSSLAKPIGRTLYFAGEATSSDETGAVSGAIATGKRAAKQLLSL